MNQNAPCKLCGVRAKLIKRSHIIPSFMYKGLFDEKNRMIIKPLTEQNERETLVQTGFFDKYILCQKCENELIGKLERYSASILYGGLKNDVVMETRKSADGLYSICMKNIDYNRFKLFLLSILWKSHVSQHKFFNKINLGKHESIIRKMLLLNDPGNEDEYQLSIIAIKNWEGELVRILPEPDALERNNQWFAHFFINGFVYFINLQPETDFVFFRKFNLKESGEIEIPVIEGNMANSYLKVLGLPDYIADFFCPAIYKL